MSYAEMADIGPISFGYLGLGSCSADHYTGKTINHFVRGIYATRQCATHSLQVYKLRTTVIPITTRKLQKEIQHEAETDYGDIFGAKC